ncbi:HIT family protein [Pectobacterium odoriferum]|nr:HIT domain-containing protein [Pectobacterium odoriferum]
MVYIPSKNSQATSCKCRFCEIVNKNVSVDIDSPWFFDEHYAALVSLGSLVPGWTLVCPKKHMFNLQCNYLEENFWEFTSKVVNDVEQLYGKVTIFEHGSTKENSQTSCGTAHAHLHVVPLSFSLINSAKLFSEEFEWSECKIEDIKERAHGQEYLFVADNYKAKNSIGIICILKNEVSQFFRKVIAKELGIAEKYNYKEFNMSTLSNKSFKELIEIQNQSTVF